MYMGIIVIVEIAMLRILVMFRQSSRSVESVSRKNGEMKIDQPNVFLSGWLKSPFIIENAPRTQTYVSSLIGGSVKSTCENLNPIEIDEIIIRQTIIVVIRDFFNDNELLIINFY